MGSTSASEKGTFIIRLKNPVSSLLVHARWRVRQTRAVCGPKTAETHLFLTASTRCFPLELRGWLTV